MTHGLICALLLLLIAALSSVGQKMITKDGMPVQVQNFYLGIYNGIPGLIVSIFQWHFGLNNLNYIFYCVFNGLVFLAAHYLTSVCYKYIDISKFLPVTYLVVVFTFIVSVTVLGEPIFLGDVLGACMIISLQFYNLTYPPYLNKEINEDDNKNNFLNKINENNNERISDEYVINRISIESDKN